MFVSLLYLVGVRHHCVRVADRAHVRTCFRCGENCGLPRTYASQCMFFNEDPRLVYDDGCWQRADGEDWDAPGNPLLVTGARQMN